MNYEETLDYLYRTTPMFSKKGTEAYKPGLERTRMLDDITGNPHNRYKCIHIAGSNGKGSVAHLLAAVLHLTGNRVGLYTSPHLLDFRERIKINGKPITNQFVVDFVNKNIKFIERERPSFFELTTIMAFDYFRHKKVNYAIIETGLGGRLDSTNIIKPMLCIITSLSLEHTHILGNTLLEIAREKAGIIKPHIPVIIGEIFDEDVKSFLRNKAMELSAPLIFSTHRENLLDADIQNDGSWVFESADFGRFSCELRGFSQKFNVQTVLSALRVLSKMGTQIRIPAVRNGFKKVTSLTGLMGRWHEVSSRPKVICDIAHNEGAWQLTVGQIAFEAKYHDSIHIIVGFSKDKNIDKIFYLMPKNATYYFTQASVDRAIPADTLAEKGYEYGLNGEVFSNVEDAVNEAVINATNNDFILISGSAFVVADALKLYPEAIAC
ncbi:MAG: bifunctional folylpolyglutamate synthase/dihydrofolate synthase [Tannerella sp.]|nr:bifunctional folylpolyglutamate synthase/dihydrofolate synthase [Tannerella sp.]